MRKNKDNYPVWLLNMDSMTAEYLIELVMLIVFIFVFQEEEIPAKFWLFGILVGICFYAGKQCMAQSVVRGYAGPAQSLSSTMTIYSTLLTTFIMNQPLHLMELLGLVAGIAGAVFITGGDFVIYKIKMGMRYR